MGNFESHEGTYKPSTYPFSNVSLDLSKLLIDQAYIVFLNNVTHTQEPVLTYTLTDECDSCLPKPLVSVPLKELEWVTVDTKYRFDIYVGEKYSLCRGADYGEFGVCNCLLYGTEDGLRCDCAEDLPAAHMGWPILCCSMFYLALIPLWFLVRFGIRSWNQKQRSSRLDSLFLNGLFSNPVQAIDSGNTGNRINKDPRITPRVRIRSIDTFRGIALIMMMFANYGHGDYRQFSRGPWNGIYFADLPFPWMLWLMGVCIPICLRYRLEQSKGSKFKVFQHIIRRSILMFLIGLSLGSVGETVPDLETLRVLGVLQRFAIIYFVMASLHLFCIQKPLKKWEVLSDIFHIWIEWIFVLVIIIVYLLVLFLLQVPGCPRGYLGPGGRHDASKYSNCTGGATMYVDHKILGEHHTSRSPSYQYIYDTTVRFDSEGVLSTLPAFLTVLLGIQAGMIIVCFQSWKQRVARWSAWCIAMGAITAFLCQVSKDDGWIPINRNLWSLSFVTFTSFCAFLALTICYLLIEVSSFYNGAPFYYPGTNALLVYVGNTLTLHMFPWTWTNSDRSEESNTHGYRLVVDVWAVTLCTLITTVNLDDLGIDQAFVLFLNNVSENGIRTYTLTDQCYGCDPEQYVELAGYELTGPNKLSTKFDTDMYVSKAPFETLSACSVPNFQDNNKAFGEFGVYECIISETQSTLQCECINDIWPADNSFFPILWCGLFCLGLIPIWFFILYLYRRHMRNRSQVIEEEDHGGTEDQKLSKTGKTRLKAIDTFRGMSIATMIFVNYGGGQYWFFNHVPWNGLTLADIVFPWFMWLMGVCIPISLRAQLKKGASKKTVFLRIVKRSIILFALGLFLGGGTDVQSLRIMGVLQRFGITYIIVAGFHLLFLTEQDKIKKLSFLRDVLNVWMEWLVVLALVLVNLLIVFFLEVPGCPKGYLGPGGRHDRGQYANCTGGATGYVDRVIFGDHAYQYPTPQEVYDTTMAFDPEGLLGVLLACLTVFLGLQAGMAIVSFKSWKQRTARWAIWFLITGTIGTILCKASKEEGWIPVNKNLWSLSFVLVTACLAYFMLTVCYMLIDVLKWWNGSPFFFAGMNSILLYVGHELTINIFPWTWYNSDRSSAVNTHGYQLAVDLWGTALWIIISFWLYNISFFIAI